MDGRRFDSFTKHVAGSSRRSLLKAALGTVVGGTMAVTGLAETDAASLRKLGQICRKDGDCASARCGPQDSRGRGRCICDGAADCPVPKNPCQEATCSPSGSCGVAPRDCDDGNACTIDSCDPQVGCTHTQIICDDSNACTKDTCDPQLGCVFTAIECDDGNACTTNTCDKTIGCVYTPITCPAQCDSDVGCVECLVASDCADFDGFCKTATCDDGVCNTVLYDPGTSCAVSSNGGVCDNNRICCAAAQTEGVCNCPEGFSMDIFGTCCPRQVMVSEVCT